MNLLWGEGVDRRASGNFPWNSCCTEQCASFTWLRHIFIYSSSAPLSKSGNKLRLQKKSQEIGSCKTPHVEWACNRVRRTAWWWHKSLRMHASLSLSGPPPRSSSFEVKTKRKISDSCSLTRPVRRPDDWIYKQQVLVWYFLNALFLFFPLLHLWLFQSVNMTNKGVLALSRVSDRWKLDKDPSLWCWRGLTLLFFLTYLTVGGCWSGSWRVQPIVFLNLEMKECWCQHHTVSEKDPFWWEGVRKCEGSGRKRGCKLAGMSVSFNSSVKYVSGVLNKSDICNSHCVSLPFSCLCQSDIKLSSNTILYFPSPLVVAWRYCSTFVD